MVIKSVDIKIASQETTFANKTIAGMCTMFETLGLNRKKGSLYNVALNTEIRGDEKSGVFLHNGHFDALINTDNLVVSRSCPELGGGFELVFTS